VAVNLGIKEVKYSGGKDYKLSKGVVSYCRIRRTGIVIIKGVPDLVYLLEKGYYYTVLLLHIIKAALILLYI